MDQGRCVNSIIVLHLLFLIPDNPSGAPIPSGFLSQQDSDRKTLYSGNCLVNVTSLSKYFYGQFVMLVNIALFLNFANLDNIRSLSIIRRAEFDLSSLQRCFNDNLSDLIIFAQYYRNAIVYINFRRYIQSLGCYIHNPFLHCRKNEYLRSFKNLCITVLLLLFKGAQPPTLGLPLPTHRFSPNEDIQ